MDTSKQVTVIETILLAGAGVYLSSWIVGHPILYGDSGPVLSPFTAFSIILMSGARLCERHLTNWPMPLTMAWLGVVIGGNLASLMAQISVPTLFLDSFPGIVPTSIPTSIGLVLFCSYELLVLVRDTPEQTFIVDDILLHLALLPGVLSIIGHWLDNPYYISSPVDPRVGIGYLEMAIMAAYAVASVLKNQQLFLWRFLRESHTNKLIFALLFANQFFAPILVAHLRGSQRGIPTLGIEVFVLVAGVLATISFLVFSAFSVRRSGGGTGRE